MTIKFGTSKYYSHSYLSPTSSHSFVINKIRWDSFEHYYQAMKYKGTDLEEKIRCSSTPSQARLIGSHQNEISPRLDWERVRDKVIYKGLYAKFTQNEKIHNLLIDTQDELMYMGGDYMGKDNKLGNLMMRLRNRLLRECENNEDISYDISNNSTESTEIVGLPNKTHHLKIEIVLSQMANTIISSPKRLSFVEIKAKIPFFNSQLYNLRWEPYFRRYAIKLLELKDVRETIINYIDNHKDEIISK